MANSPARVAVDVGSVIADTYKIEALLGRGGMGAVFLASHKRLAGKHVAIKILHLEIEDADIIARFRREAEIAAKLNHPNIVGVIDYNVAPDGMPYLVLDYLEGETLAQRIARGPMALDQVLSIVRQVGSALAAAHRAGIVHRDLKPQNIFLVPTEVDGRHVEIAKVLDFGISKIRGSQTVKTQDSALLGTPQYMAPEQAMGQHANVDERTDVFALGAIVYEMLTGQPAFSGASIPEVVFKVVYEQPLPLATQVPTVPPAVATAVNQAMAKTSDERFPTVAGFVEAITGQPFTLRGQPLSPTTNPDVPSASRRVATGEAYARTMGSGDHGESPVNPLLATAAPGATTPGPSPLPSATRAAPTVDYAALTRRPRRSPLLIAAIVIAGAAIAGTTVYLVRRPDPPGDNRIATGSQPASAGDTKSTDSKSTDSRSTAPNGTDSRSTDSKSTDSKSAEPNPTDSKSTDSKSTDSKSTDSKSTDSKSTEPNPTDSKATDSKSADSKSTDAKQPAVPPRPPQRPGLKPPRPNAPPPPPPIEDDDVQGDDEIRQKLKQAAAALDRRDYDLAERLATAVINSPAGPRQHATARLIHGTVQCVARNDQEAAGIDLRRLEGFRALRAKLLDICRSRGVVNEP